MKPVEFKGSNVIFGVNQPEYLPLPALRLENETGTVITCWELTDEEVQELVKHKRLYISMFTFNKPLTPILPGVSLEEVI